MVLAVVVAILAVGMLVVVAKDRDLRDLVINEVDLSRIPDGVYVGSFRNWRMMNEVEVTVEDHRIIAIENTNNMPDDRSRTIVEQATEAVLAGQSVQIDTISGASLNTKAFQKAVENALTDGLK